jgi:hypothetical protein
MAPKKSALLAPISRDASGLRLKEPAFAEGTKRSNAQQGGRRKKGERSDCKDGRVPYQKSSRFGKISTGSLLQFKGCKDGRDNRRSFRDINWLMPDWG